MTVWLKLSSLINLYSPRYMWCTGAMAIHFTKIANSSCTIKGHCFGYIQAANMLNQSNQTAYDIFSLCVRSRWGLVAIGVVSIFMAIKWSPPYRSIAWLQYIGSELNVLIPLFQYLELRCRFLRSCWLFTANVALVAQHGKFSSIQTLQLFYGGIRNAH